jgi:hypothetical protein
MFCPKCAAQNLDGASFCRSCGANVSLVPQALTGQLPRSDEPDDEVVSKRHGKSRLSLEHAFKNVFMGVAFLLVAAALAFSRMGGGWWFWMLIPAFAMMGTGIAQYLRIKEREKQMFQRGGINQPVLEPPQQSSFPARQTGELVSPPPSVTEGTTRHLGAEAPTRHFETSNDSTPK